MRPVVLVLIFAITCVQVDCQFWKYPHEFISTWLRQGKTDRGDLNVASTTPFNMSTTSTRAPGTGRATITKTTVDVATRENKKTSPKVKTSAATTPGATKTTTRTTTITTPKKTSTASTSASTTTTTTPKKPTTILTEANTMTETITHDVTATTEEPRENQRTHDFYLSKREKPQVKIASNISQNLLPLPEGASAALVKPTKYHFYPHNQHMYILPECAIQQVCNAVYVRLNWTQPLCACPSRYRDPCSASLNSDDLHTTELMTERKSKRALTLVKTCEPTAEMRVCRSPRDWSLLALQNIRTGKSHYLVICRCPDTSILEGPMSHDQPHYASVPGIRVYGMMCVDGNRRGRPLRTSRSFENPPFPWDQAIELIKTPELWK